MLPETRRAPVPAFVTCNLSALRTVPAIFKSLPSFEILVNEPLLTTLPAMLSSPALLTNKTSPALFSTLPVAPTDKPLTPTFLNAISPSRPTFLTRPSTVKPSFAPYDVIVTTPLLLLNVLALEIWSTFTID